MSLYGLVLSSGWASGINLYAVVAMLGIAGRLGLADVPSDLERIEVLAVAGALYAVEFVVDKIPWLDSAWDVVHTAIRPVGAAAVALVLAGDATSLEQAMLTAGGGLFGLAAHAAKASVRAAVNTSPEPASNILVSLLEDVVVAGVVALALAAPEVALIIALVLTITSLTVAALLVATLRTAWRRLLERRRERARRTRV
ncbi:MAG: DUF4126 domain-containing protein [Nitriliruptorales bacterium]|nr:DUF4126 domain-containing protein [Nitriliruptorales bacterium]